jgi:hypothetical protein
MFLGSVLCGCSCSPSQVVFCPSRVVLRAVVFVVAYLDSSPSSPTLSLTSLTLHKQLLHLHPTDTCGVYNKFLHVD